MLTCPMDVLTAFPVRKSKKQKQVFRDEVQALVQSWDYCSAVEKGSMGSRNLIIGDPAKAKYLITAHYDTCARLIVPNLIAPTSLWLFILSQLAAASVMLALPLVAAAPVWFLTHSNAAAYWTWYGLLLVFLVLMMAGPANPSNSNDNTSGVVTLLEIARSLPENQRERACFVLFDLEEMGLIGSSSYQSRHKGETLHQTVLNLDCVGDGDDMLLLPTRALRRDAAAMAALRRCTGSFGEKRITLREKGFSVYPSDQASFPRGVGIAALRRNRFGGLYLGRIHTPRDTVLEQTNINLLRAALISVVSGDAVQQRKEIEK